MTSDERYDEMDDRFWAAARDKIDTDQVSPARVYDYLLGGSYNFPTDRAAGDAIAALNPDASRVARANRAFLRRAVVRLASQGHRQYLDIGSGLPTVGNVHEIAQANGPDAGIIYIDNDPVAVAHSREILRDNPRATAVGADMRRVDELLHRLADPRLRQIVDLDQPVVLLLVAVLHFFPDDAEPQQLVATLRDALAPGSALVISHIASESFAQADVEAVQNIYRKGGAAQPFTRTRQQVQAFFGDFQLMGPGVVHVSQWHPEIDGGEPEEFAQNPARSGSHAGVAIKVPSSGR